MGTVGTLHDMQDPSFPCFVTALSHIRLHVFSRAGPDPVGIAFEVLLNAANLLALRTVWWASIDRGVPCAATTSIDTTGLGLRNPLISCHAGYF